MERQNGILGPRAMRKVFARLVAGLVLTFCLVQSFSAATPADKKPFVVVVYADWCPTCQELKPTLLHINQKYQNRIHFVRYDITSEESAERSNQTMAQMGLADFFDKYERKTSLVVILDSSKREVLRTYNDFNREHYEKALDQLLASTPGN